MRRQLLRKLMYRYSDYRRIKELNIKHSGITKEGIAFITLEGDKHFYGYAATTWQKYLHTLWGGGDLFDNVAFNVAYDIVLRYLGPKKDHLKRGKYYNFNSESTILEVGAYLGYYAMRASEIVGPNGQVIAIEAIPENYKILKMNIKQNNLLNIKAVNRGVYSENTSLIFYRQSKQRASFVKGVVKNNEKIEIKVDTLDQIVKNLGLQKVDFVRIQTNGGEIHTLEGSNSLLSHYRPVFLVTAPYGTIEKVSAILQANKYTASIHDGNILAVPL